MAGRPSKSVELILMEGNKDHRTKAEIKQRKQGEESTITGEEMTAWSSLDKVAKKEFKRIKGLFKKIDKDDAIYESVINRYCELKAECDNYKTMTSSLVSDLMVLIESFKDGDMEFLSYISEKDKINKSILSVDRQVQAKRKMMLDIEKENIMTIAAALRSIPKKPVKKEELSGMGKFLADRNK